MGRLGKGLVRTCFLMAAAVESPEARTANGLVSPFFVKLNLIQVIGSTSGDEAAEISRASATNNLHVSLATTR